MLDLQKVLDDDDIDTSTLGVLGQTVGTTIYRLSAPGGRTAEEAWRQLRALVPKSGHWPVILGEPEKVDQSDLPWHLARSTVRETLAFAQTISFPNWFEKRRQERLTEFLEYNEGEDPEQAFANEGQWPPNVAAMSDFHTPFDYRTRKPAKEVVIALIPTVQSWEVPAYLGLGGWNACPEAAVHCAALRYWNGEYGCEIVVATHDVIEAHVERPPKTRDGALALARQQYEYCADIVEQGTETMSVLAASLLGSKKWFFWWD